MKKLLFLLLTISLLSFTTSTSDFCRGFHEGYQDGWCNLQQGCIPPVPPLCPTPELNQDTYKHGYMVGFKRGRAARR
jgi:hypothetical protein